MDYSVRLFADENYSLRAGMMTIASIFNYFEAALWFAIELTVFVKGRTETKQLKSLAMIVSVSFGLFGISDLVEASTGA